ncbi:MAG: MATE family efflux transporter [Anaerorhabdus sp.]
MSKLFGDKKFIISVLTIAIPIMFQQLITGSVQLIDNLMVGSLGDYVVSAVGASNRFYLIGQSGMFGLSVAGSIFVAQFYGARNNEKTKECFRVIVLSLLVIAALFTMVAFFFPSNIINFFYQDDIISKYGVSYLSIVAFTFIPVSISLSISTSLKAIGKLKLQIFISAIAVILNTVLNYFLIFGNFGFPELGVSGAAIATLIARIVECGLFILAMMKNDFVFKTKLSNIFHISKGLTKKIYIKALPLMANEIGWAFGMATLYMLYSKGGADVGAGYMVASTVSDIFFILFAGMGAASTVLIAQPLGANNLEEGRSNGYRLIGLSALMSLVFAFSMFMFSFVIPYLYNDLSFGAKEFAVTMLRIQSIMFIFFMISTQNYFILRAGGDTLSTFIFDSCFMWLINIPVVWYLTMYTDLPVYIIFICGQSVEFLKIALGAYLVKREKWVHNLAK